MTRLRALIVDDERLAREKLRRLLAAERDVEVVGECANGPEAVAAIRRDKPELLFLDIQMPGLDAFGVLAEVGAQNAGRVIFVTAHDEFAVRAFEVEALDYLLKPFDAARLRQAVARARRQEPTGLPERIEALLARIASRDSRVSRLLVKSAGRMSFVRVEELDFLEAADNYVRLHTGREEHLIRETLANLESRLDPKRFLRVHRRVIVNLDAVAEVRAVFHGDYEVLLKTGASVPVGRNFRDRLISTLGG